MAGSGRLRSREGQRMAMASEAPNGIGSPRVWRRQPPALLRGAGPFVFILPAAVLLGVWLIPLASLGLRGLGAGALQHLGDPMVLQALRLSLLTSTIAAVLAVLTGTPLAYALSRWEFHGRALIDVLIDLTLVLPPAVAGVSLLIAFGRRGVLGPLLSALGVSLPFTTAAVVLAQLFVAAPFFVRAARLGFDAIDPQLEEAATTEGASPWQLFRFVMLPLAGRSILSGLVMCWTRALGEFGATILFAGNMPGRTQTMPLAIYLGFEREVGVALALSVVLLLTSGILLLAVRRLEGSALPAR
jgi:molybdate transport system permease protein